MRRCRHQWETVGQRFTPPPSLLRFKQGSGSDQLTLIVMYGLTVVTQRCEHCGLEKAYTVPGQAADKRQAVAS
jgi:hypothetical protein